MLALPRAHDSSGWVVTGRYTEASFEIKEIDPRLRPASSWPMWWFWSLYLAYWVTRFGICRTLSTGSRMISDGAPIATRQPGFLPIPVGVWRTRQWSPGRHRPGEELNYPLPSSLSRNVLLIWRSVPPRHHLYFARLYGSRSRRAFARIAPIVSKLSLEFHPSPLRIVRRTP
jgi:hypothetical protein